MLATPWLFSGNVLTWCMLLTEETRKGMEFKTNAMKLEEALNG